MQDVLFAAYQLVYLYYDKMNTNLFQTDNKSIIYEIRDTNMPRFSNEILLREVRCLIHDLKSNRHFSDDIIKRFLQDIQHIWNKSKFDPKSTNSINLLKDLAGIFYESSLEDGKFFRQIYAKVCIKMSGNYYTTTSTIAPGTEKNIYFGDLLMDKWKKELDSEFFKEINNDSLLEECRDNLEMKLILKESNNLKLTDFKQRFFNNILFIGECYGCSFPLASNRQKQLPISDELLSACIEKLIIKETREDYLECLCHFLMVIGEKYDKPNNAATMEILFNKLNAIRRNDYIALNTRLLIVDVIKLRLNKWSKYIKSKIESYEKKLCQLLLENQVEQNEDILRSKIKVCVYLFISTSNRYFYKPHLWV